MALVSEAVTCEFATRTITSFKIMLQIYARNRLVWPLSLGFTFITWILNGWIGLGGKMPHQVLTTPFFDYLLGMVVCAAAIYMLAEINTRFAFLSNTDRTISLTFIRFTF